MVVNSVIAIATARTLIEENPDEHLKCIDLNSTNWTQSLFRRMGIVKRMCTTSRPEIADRAAKEVSGKIANLVEVYAIPPSLIINFDQTPLKYAFGFQQFFSKERIKARCYCW